MESESPNALSPACICLYLPQSTGLETLAEACFRFSSKVALRPGEAVFVEASRGGLLHAAQGLSARLEALCRRLGFPARLVAAADAGTALALARFRISAPQVLPLEALADFSSPFQALDDEARKAFSKGLDSLRKLGLKTLADFSALPSGPLGSRFHPGIARLWRRLRGQESEVWPEFKPREEVIESLDLVSDEGRGCADLEPLLFMLKNPVERLMARLRGRGLRLAALETALDMEGGFKGSRGRSLCLRMPLPQASAREVLRLLHEGLAAEMQARPLPAPLTQARLRVLETAPGLERQPSLLGSELEDREAYRSLVDRLARRLGSSQVFSALPVERYLPEASWQRAVKELIWPGPQRPEFFLPAFLPPRPLRVLKRPEPLFRQGSLLFDAQKRRWNVLQAEGPERLEGEWWMDEDETGFARDYYRVVAESGEQLWVFCRAEGEPGKFEDKQGLYLHGYFD